MITGISITTNLPNIEHMMVSGKATPASETMTITVMREELTAPQQDVYDAAVLLVSGKAFTKINNTTSELDISRITSQVVIEDEDVFDFLLMSVGDQDALRALLALFVELSN